MSKFGHQNSAIMVLIHIYNTLNLQNLFDLSIIVFDDQVICLLSLQMTCAKPVQLISEPYVKSSVLFFSDWGCLIPSSLPQNFFHNKVWKFIFVRAPCRRYKCTVRWVLFCFFSWKDTCFSIKLILINQEKKPGVNWLRWTMSKMSL